MNFVYIEYIDPVTQSNPLTVKFKLLDHEITKLWVQAVQDAQQKQYPIDDPARFYGFNSADVEKDLAIKKLNRCIDTINDYKFLIDRKISSINDQDTLNYLHHIFEIYHGLLEKPHKFYLNSPPHIKKALSDLNILVHRCESTQRMRTPRHVVTYFGLPKTRFLKEEHYSLFTNQTKFGTICLNYVEIGKTINDLSEDNDCYISPEAFKPFKRYSADFVVRYWETDPLYIKERNARIQAYYEKHRDFFGPWQSCFVDGTIPVAVIDQELNPMDLIPRQYVKSVSIK